MRRLKLLPLVFLTVGFLIVETASPAYAQITIIAENPLINLFEGAVTAVFNVTLQAYLVSLFINAVAAFLLLIANGLVGLALDFNSAITHATFIQGGYNVVLGVANMGFIVALVVIAFATMLRLEGFSYQRALPRLIIAALLINFGFFIVTDGFIKPVDEITNSLRQSAGFGSGTFQDIFKPGGGFFNDIKVDVNIPFLGNIPGFGGALNSLFSGVVGPLIKAVFGTVFEVVGVLALFALAAMFFIRGIALSFLIILLPLAWIAWIFPNLKLSGGIGNPWQEWWENFTRWLLFAPFAMFFLWLAIKLAENKESFNKLFPNGSDNAVTALAQMFVIVGLLLGGLLVSNRMGIRGSGYALAIASRGRDWVKYQGKRLGTKAGYRVLKSKPVESRIQKMQTAGVGTKYAAIAAPIRAAGRQSVRTRTRGEQFLQESAKKKFEGIPPYAIAEMYKGLNDYEKKAAVSVMTEKGYQWELPEGWLDDVARWGEKDSSGRNAFQKEGFQKLDLDLWDKGIFSSVLTARGGLTEAEKNLEKAQARKAPPDEIAALEKIRKEIEERDQPKIDEAFTRSINILGAKGIPNIDFRMLSPGAFKGFSTKAMEEKYREGLITTTAREIPAGLNPLRGRIRGGEGLRNFDAEVDKYTRTYEQRVFQELGGLGGGLKDDEDKGEAYTRLEAETTTIPRAGRPDLPPVAFSRASIGDKTRWIQDNWPKIADGLKKEADKRIDTDDTIPAAAKRDRKETEHARIDTMSARMRSEYVANLRHLNAARGGGFAGFVIGGGPTTPAS